MDKLLIKKSLPLQGNVTISGSKNSILPLLAASLLIEEEVVFKDVPELSDVITMKKLITHFGAKTSWIESKTGIKVKTQNIITEEADYDLVSKMRASFLVMGPILARTGKIKVPLPGGCAIGSRPVDLHLKGLTALGATIIHNSGYVLATAKKLVGSKIYLDFPSVGATENIIMAAVLAEGTTVIENCAVEPEIVDLANFLNSAGANIRGAGTDTIKILGVDELHKTEHTVIPDRIEAGTFMLAAAITKGNITINNIVSDHLKPIIAKLRECNVNVTEIDNGLIVVGNDFSIGTDIKTMPYPGFPTDMQSLFMSFLTTTNGPSLVTETVFENRFMHVGELKRMGADIKIESRSAVIDGVKELTGAKVKATDLRAGAALILAALIAEGETEISDIYHIDRGYCDYVNKFRALGGIIEKIN